MDLYEMLADTPQSGPPEPFVVTNTQARRYETETRVVETGDEDRGGLLVNQITP